MMNFLTYGISTKSDGNDKLPPQNYLSLILRMSDVLWNLPEKVELILPGKDKFASGNCLDQRLHDIRSLPVGDLGPPDYCVVGKQYCPTVLTRLIWPSEGAPIDCMVDSIIHLFPSDCFVGRFLFLFFLKQDSSIFLFCSETHNFFHWVFGLRILNEQHILEYFEELNTLRVPSFAASIGFRGSFRHDFCIYRAYNAFRQQDLCLGWCELSLLSGFAVYICAL